MNKYERGIQIYDLLRTARLNVLYYEESLKRWTYALRTHDFVVAVTGTASPIAFFKHSGDANKQALWFCLTLVAGFAAILKPILRWDRQVALYAELVTHYREIHQELKCIADDMTALREFSPQLEKKFLACRLKENNLQKKEPPPNRAKAKRMQRLVEQEYDMSKIWLPENN